MNGERWGTSGKKKIAISGKVESICTRAKATVDAAQKNKWIILIIVDYQDFQTLGSVCIIQVKLSL